MPRCEHAAQKLYQCHPNVCHSSGLSPKHLTTFISETTSISTFNSDFLIMSMLITMQWILNITTSYLSASNSITVNTKICFYFTIKHWSMYKMSAQEIKTTSTHFTKYTTKSQQKWIKQKWAISLHETTNNFKNIWANTKLIGVARGSWCPNSNPLQVMGIVETRRTSWTGTGRWHGESHWTKRSCT